MDEWSEKYEKCISVMISTNNNMYILTNTHTEAYIRHGNDANKRKTHPTQRWMYDNPLKEKETRGRDNTDASTNTKTDCFDKYLQRHTHTHTKWVEKRRHNPTHEVSGKNIASFCEFHCCINMKITGTFIWWHPAKPLFNIHNSCDSTTCKQRECEQVNIFSVGIGGEQLVVVRTEYGILWNGKIDIVASEQIKVTWVRVMKGEDGKRWENPNTRTTMANGAGGGDQIPW